MGRVYLTKGIEERVWPKVNRRGPNECWEWQGAKTSFGYGYLLFDSRKPSRHPRRAHRVMYELVKGPIPVGLCVLHRCDNPPCVNPRHLFVGTQRDNNLDRWKKGRYAGNGERRTGGDHPRAVLTNAQAAEIRRRYKGRGQPSHEALAREFGVNRTTVSLVLEGKSYPA